MSPETAAVGVYFPVPRKNRIALFWTALMHENKRSPHTAAPYAVTVQTTESYSFVNTWNGNPPRHFALAIKSSRALLALCAITLAVTL